MHFFQEELFVLNFSPFYFTRYQLLCYISAVITKHLRENYSLADTAHPQHTIPDVKLACKQPIAVGRIKPLVKKRCIWETWIFEIKTDSVHFASRLPWDFMTDNDQKWGYLYAKYQSSTARIKLTRRIKRFLVCSLLFRHELQSPYKSLPYKSVSSRSQLDNQAITARLALRQEVLLRMRDPSRCDRSFASNLRWTPTNIRCVTSQKSEVRIYTAAEALNLTRYFSIPTSPVQLWCSARPFNGYRVTFPREQGSWCLKLTNRLHLVTRKKWTELYLHSHIQLNGVVFKHKGSTSSLYASTNFSSHSRSNLLSSSPAIIMNMKVLPLRCKAVTRR